MKGFTCLIFCLSLLVACVPEQLNPDPPANRTDILTPTPCAATKTAQAPSLSTDQINSDLLLIQLKDLTDEYRTLILANQGWLHLITRHTEPKGSDPLSGEPTNVQYEQEGWYLLKSQGETLMGATRRLDPLGLQEIKGGPWARILQGEENQLSLLDTIDAGRDFYQKTSQFVKQGRMLNKSMVYRNCWYIGEKYSIREGELLHEAVFNPDNGKLVYLSDWDVTRGSIRLINNLEIVLEERVLQPPADVQALLGIENKPK